MKTTKRGGGSKAGKPVPAEGLPSGWMTRDKPRYATFGNKDSMRKYWYSPILKLQFRSRECDRLVLSSSEYMPVMNVQNLTTQSYVLREL